MATDQRPTWHSRPAIDMAALLCFHLEGFDPDPTKPTVPVLHTIPGTGLTEPLTGSFILRQADKTFRVTITDLSDPKTE